jgi:SAM-dependent methyltransferase
MRTFYEGHDRVYKSRLQSREHGWGTAREAEENFRRLQPFLPGDLPPNPKVLDLGCGSGELTWHYAKLWSAITGVDIAPTAIAWARERLPTLKFLTGSILDPAMLPAKEFDLALDSNCLHCIIGPDRRQLLRNAREWLKEGGYLVLHTMCNEPVGDLWEGYDPDSRLIFRGEIAIRYLGTAEAILQEVAGAGFHLLGHEIFQRLDGPDILVSLHQKREKS